MTNKRLEKPKFRLLASVYAALGPDAFNGRYKSMAHHMGSEATPKAIYCFLKYYVAPAAQELKAFISDDQESGGVPRQDEASNGQLASARSPLDFPMPQADSFGHKLDEEIYRCMLCQRQFGSHLSLSRHESQSDMHLVNLEDPTVVATGRARLANILQSAAK